MTLKSIKYMTITIMALCLGFLGSVSIAHAQVGCQSNETCAPASFGAWRYFAHFNYGYLPTSSFQSSPAAAYDILLGRMKERQGANCIVTFSPLSEFSFSPGTDKFGGYSFTMYSRLADESKFGCNGYPTGTFPFYGSVSADREAACPAGWSYRYLSSGSLCVSQLPPYTLQLSASTIKIAESARVQNGKVQTYADIVATLTQNGAPVSGKIKWLPAQYDESFLVTCYIIADEENEPAKPTQSNVCGLPKDKTYRSRFLKDTKMQGSGKALDGSIVHYAGNGCYEVLSCAMTATGTCAKEGETIAVDTTVIPRRSNVTVAILGARKAQDKGGRIKGYHIDEFMGPQPKKCAAWGMDNTSTITLDSY